MPYLITYAAADRKPEFVEADEHRVEGGWHVLRTTTPVMARPRRIVALRVRSEAF